MEVRGQAPKIVLINERNMNNVPNKVALWLERHYPGHKTNQMAVVKQNDRMLLRVNVQTANGQMKNVFFDVTAAARSNMNTVVQYAPVGTMVRLHPGTTSTPTRIERLF